jgi:hypothetical protein
VAVTQRQGDQVVATTTGGLVVGYSPEYALPDGGPNPLPAAAALVGGRVLERPEQAFDHAGLAPAWSVVDLWPPLLLLALLLLPLDIAIRRLTLGREDLAALRARLGRRQSATGATSRPPSSPLMIRLAAGKRRARVTLPSAAPPTVPPADAPFSPPAPPDAPDPPISPPPTTPSDTLTRLREARRRARRE